MGPWSVMSKSMGNPIGTGRAQSAGLGGTVKTAGAGKPADVAVFCRQALWANGKWKLVVRRAVVGTGKDVKFEGSRLFLSFATWDGAFGDRDGQKSVSHWHILDLK